MNRQEAQAALDQAKHEVGAAEEAESRGRSAYAVLRKRIQDLDRSIADAEAEIGDLLIEFCNNGSLKPPRSDRVAKLRSDRDLTEMALKRLSYRMPRWTVAIMFARANCLMAESQLEEAIAFEEERAALEALARLGSSLGDAAQLELRGTNFQLRREYSDELAMESGKLRRQADEQSAGLEN